MEEILPIECEIPSLKIVVELLPATFIEEGRLLHLTHLHDTWCDVSLANEAHKICIKAQYNKIFKPHVFSKGDLVIIYDKEYDKLGS